MFGKLFKSQASQPAAPLAKITERADHLLSRIKASPEACALYHPGQTAGETLQQLEKHFMPVEAVNFLAHGLPERDAVKWAVDCSRLVAAKLNPADQKALTAAETWLANPIEETRAAAGTAADASNGAGPGGWAAQAAAWTKPSDESLPPGTPGPAEEGAGSEEAPEMTAVAVAGAVMLAAGLTEKPPMEDTPRPNAELAKTEASKAEMSPPPAAPDASTAVQNAQEAVKAAPSAAAPPATAVGGKPALPEVAVVGKPVLPEPALPGKPTPPEFPVPGAQPPVAEVPKPGIPEPAQAAPASATPAPGTSAPEAPAAEVPKLSPEDAKAFCKKLAPFLDLGKQIAG